MKTLFILIVFTLFIRGTVKQKNSLYTVSGRITISENYCGVVKPSDNMLKRLSAKRPFEEFTIYIKKGKENRVSSPIIDSVVSDERGVYSLQLLPGDYVLLEYNQLDTTILEKYKTQTRFIQADNLCMEEWWKKGMASITLTNKNIDSLNFHFQKKCFIPEIIPCLLYSGPAPR